VSPRSKGDNEVGGTYRKRARRYDAAVHLFDLFRPFGFDLPAWREEAVRALDLKRGDTVVDVGCGTGLNFPLLQERIGPEGRIVGVDLSAAMLDQARGRVAGSGWQNVELICGDAAQFVFPPGVDGILSTFALILVPECGQVVRNACQAVGRGRRLAVLDMAWPASWPGWFRHMLFFLRSYGVTDEVLQRRPWETIWTTMQESLVDTTRKGFFMGGAYLAAGTRATNGVPPSGPGSS
jgi:ubiquinone/menaquinone biosynthesis C-methylase UbiE